MGVPIITLLLSVTVSLLGGLIFGYELGIISGVLLQLKNEFLLTCFQQEVLVSAVLVGALVASLVGGFFIDHSGRRTSILASNVVVLSGSIILISSGSFWWLVVGRVTIGFAISISSMACCIYVSEIVQPQQRGMLVSLYETGITVGILLSFGVNYFLSGWKYMFGLAIFPALLQFISILFLPSEPSKVSSPDGETHNVLIQLQDFEEVEDLKTSSSNKVYSFLDLFSTKDNMRTRTLVGVGLVFFQQLTGQPNVLYYASTIFRSVGFQSNSSAMLASVGLGVVKVLSTLIAMSCADKAGRRVLLLTGCVIMTISITGIGCASFMIQLDPYKSCESLAQVNASSHLSNSTIRLESIDDLRVSLHAQLSDTKMAGQVFTSDMISSYTSGVTGPSRRRVKHTDPLARAGPLRSRTALNWITLLSLMAFVSAFSIGFGPMTWLVLSEIYPTEIRGRAFAFCNSLNWATNLLITLTFLDVIESIGLSWTFLLYGIIGVVAIIFIYLFIPETKGRSLQEIDKLFSDKRFLSRSPVWGIIQSGHRYRKMEQSTTSDSSASSCF
ncbi:solute carrier family 2, facilitated glucose transporter member 10 [Bufo gargarizans]|uniref:solute carrier family 2, facilitated glucose transporter member 10 n=1 Tax=Bufo gargarizans TaxID=30331 RepID=UPI001CF19183|nr:solute carrier family 2, facilitated glucose transporter member 10 [Bufo gargarizans]